MRFCIIMKNLVGMHRTMTKWRASEQPLESVTLMTLASLALNTPGLIISKTQTSFKSDWIDFLQRRSGKCVSLMSLLNILYEFLLITILFFLSEKTTTRGRKKCVFCVEEMWFQDVSCIQICQAAWSNYIGLLTPHRIKSQLESCKSALQTWESTHFGNVKNQLSECRKELESLQANGDGMHHNLLIRETEAKLDDLLRKEELIWK